MKTPRGICFILLIIVMFCFSSCQTREYDVENENLYLENNANVSEHTLSSSNKDFWIPNENEPWNFTVVPTGMQYSIPNDATFNYSVSLNQMIYFGVPRYIEYTIINETGDGVYLAMIYIEKLYNVNSLSSPVSVPEDAVGGWIRIPYYVSSEYCDDNSNKLQGRLDLQEHLKANYEYTAGSYRVAFPLNDGTYYAYFKIK